MHREQFAPSAIIFATFLWGLGDNVAKFITASGAAISFFRLWVGTAFALGIFVLKKRQIDQQLVLFAFLGGILFAAHIFVFFSAVKLTSIANVTFISALQPVLVFFVAGYLFGEKISLATLRQTFLAIAGLALLLYGSAGTTARSLTGDLLAVANLFLWTAYFLVSKQARKHVATIEYQTGVIVVACLVATLPSLLFTNDLGAVTGWDWVGVVSLALIGTTGHFLMNWAHKHVKVVFSSLLVLAIPVVASSLAIPFHGEEITAWHLIGGSIVLAALASTILRQEQIVPSAPSPPLPTGLATEENPSRSLSKNLSPNRSLE